MRVEWHGQSAFTLASDEATVFIDPFGEMGPLLADRGLKFDYPPIEADGVDLLLVTHEHRDHNAVEVIGGEPETLRATAGKHSTDAVGEVLGVASEHDEVAGTERGPNTIFVFELDGLRVAHFGDFGHALPQRARRLPPRDRGGVRRPDAADRPLRDPFLRHRRPACRRRPDRGGPRRALAFTSTSSSKGGAALWSSCRV